MTTTTTPPLPPYSGEKTPCAKCSFPEARTAYREAGTYHDDEPRVAGRSRPERLERECFRCDYVWDEALNPPDAPEPIGRELTITELADALSASHQGWALDLSPELAAHMAVGLLRTLDVRTRPAAGPADVPHRGRAVDLPPEMAAAMDAALLRTLGVPTTPEPAGSDGPVLVLGDPTVRCCVCGGGPVVYRNYAELPFCLTCAECPCGVVPCQRTGINAPDAAGEEQPGGAS